MAHEDRPTFKGIYSTLSKFIEYIAGYLPMSFNPFTEEGTIGEGNKEAKQKQVRQKDGKQEENIEEDKEKKQLKKTAVIKYKLGDT